MKKYQFNKEEESKAGKLYLVINFEGGDADTEHPEEVLIEDIKYNGEKELVLNEETNNLIENYKILQKVLDINTSDYRTKYNEVKKDFGEEIADLYDNTPNDPQGDYQFKCSLDNMHLKGYDEKCNTYIAHIK